jgi:hypothetical protein
LGRALNANFVRNGWVCEPSSGRLVLITPLGLTELRRLFDLSMVEPATSALCDLGAKGGQAASVKSSGAGRRTKVPEERTRGPQALRYGDFDFSPMSRMT